MSSFETVFLSAATANGSSTVQAGPGEFCRVYVAGTFGGANIVLQTRPLTAGSDFPWMSSLSLTFSANGSAVAYFSKDEEIRATLASASGTTSLTVVVIPLNT